MYHNYPRFTFIVVALLLSACPHLYAAMNGSVDYSTDHFGRYYQITGSQFVNGQTYNGNNGSGGVFRFIHDDPDSTYTDAFQNWRRDDWFPENAGLALTMRNDGVTVYDNNLIEQGDPYGPDNYYNDELNESDNPIAGLYMSYAMSNNDDWIYAGYFQLDSQTTVDTIIGYFDGTGYYGNLKPDDPAVGFRMNIWSAVDDPDAASGMLPAVDSFTGNVLTTDTGESGYAAGTFTFSDTGVKRRYSGWEAGKTDPIYRLTYELDSPVTLEAGEYFFSHDMTVPEPATMGLLGIGSLGVLIRRKRS
ncbi:MAG: PEP-CTERM sorting domain-containing protein [Phycisphaerae bacterium]